MLERLMPDVVRVAESRVLRTDETLFPQEEVAIAKAVLKRRQEYTTVRACARDALALLGMPSAPIVPGDRGAPNWPVPVVGSMTHCAGYYAAALARSEDVLGIGIDAEPDGALPRGVVEVFAGPGELAFLDALPASRHHWDRLLFSAKESVFKAWFPATGRGLDFRDVVVILRQDGTFTAQLPVVGAAWWREVAGRWLADEGLILTAVTVHK